MDLESWIELGLAALSFLTIAFVAAAERALTYASRVRIKPMRDDGLPQARLALSVLHEPKGVLFSLSILKNGALIVAAGSISLLVRQLLSEPTSAAITVVLSLLVLILSKIAPRSVATQNPEGTLLALITPAHWLSLLLSPLAYLLEGIAKLTGAKEVVPSPPLANDELCFLIDLDEDEIVIEQEEREMIASIFQFGETLAREVMVPRIDMVAVDADTPLMDALDVILKEGHSRIPVYEENIDSILGLLYAKDLLQCLRERETPPELKELLRPAYFVPESKKLDDLLQELQQRKVHMAIVVDEYGGTAGLVTIEDILEEIVGEIQDEYDREEPLVEMVSENEIIFDARVDLDDVNHLMSLNLPTEEGDTLGGLIYSQLGRVPAVDDQVILDGVKITVLSVTGRRIKKVRVAKEEEEK
ncbi:MAG: hemolysin family protein [Anaerolineae bacterium]